MTNYDLLGDVLIEQPEQKILLQEGATLLRGFALAAQKLLLASINDVIESAPFRNMVTPMGHKMAVATTSCGSVGWISDKKGYRYESIDPLTEKQWPKMPIILLKLAIAAAKEAGFDDFKPDSCLINLYQPGTKLSLHQDKDEKDFNAPIVSISLGIPATFLLGGLNRSDKQAKISLLHGDVLVLGGKARLLYHGISPLKENSHLLLDKRRINLTFRKTF